MTPSKIVQARNTARPHTFMDIGHEIISNHSFLFTGSRKAVFIYCLIAKLRLCIQCEQRESETQVSDLGLFGPLIYFSTLTLKLPITTIVICL